MQTMSTVFIIFTMTSRFNHLYCLIWSIASCSAVSGYIRNFTSMVRDGGGVGVCYVMWYQYYCLTSKCWGFVCLRRLPWRLKAAINYWKDEQFIIEVPFISWIERTTKIGPESIHSYDCGLRCDLKPVTRWRGVVTLYVMRHIGQL